MDASDVLGTVLLIAFAVIRGAFFVAVIAAVVVVVRAVLRPPTTAGSAPVGKAFATGRPSHDD